jgi:hypothetical protein
VTSGRHRKNLNAEHVIVDHFIADPFNVEPARANVFGQGAHQPDAVNPAPAPRTAAGPDLPSILARLDDAEVDELEDFPDGTVLGEFLIDVRHSDLDPYEQARMLRAVAYALHNPSRERWY